MRKTGDQLEPGDVFFIQGTRLVMLRAQGLDRANDGVLCAYLDGKGTRPEQLTTRYIRHDAQYDVEPHGPVVTPAQQHADELLALVHKLAARWSHDYHESSVVAEAKRLIKKIDPPKPTLEQITDALDELVDIINSGAGGSIGTVELQKYQEIIERARRP